MSKGGILPYDAYNREERALCAHLFRLLHEGLDRRAGSPLGHFLAHLAGSGLAFRNGVGVLANNRLENVSIYCEAALIRDAYHHAKPETSPFMDALTLLIMQQEGITACRLYSQLPEVLSNGSKTHPKQIRQKADAEGIALSPDERRVYGAMQGMFNAKPDLVIVLECALLVCEAKHTESFDDQQLQRTWNIAEVWARLLYTDLGYSDPPAYTVFKLGAAVFEPHIHWSAIARIANETYPPQDRTRIALNAGAELLRGRGWE